MTLQKSRQSASAEPRATPGSERTRLRAPSAGCLYSLLSADEIGGAVRDYYGDVDSNASTIPRSTDAGNQGAKPDQVVTPNYITEVGETLVAAE